jgi:predicted kinase
VHRVQASSHVDPDPPEPAAPTLLLLTGPPGTGKSSLAGHAAGVLGAPVLGWDWAMAAMTGFDTIQAALRDLPHVEHRRVGWSILGNLAAAQLVRGCSAVLDGVARDAEVEGTRALAQQMGAKCLVVVTSCSDRAVHRQRIEGRSRGIPGWHELDWDHVSGVLERWEPPADADLYLDAVAPLVTNAEQLVLLLAPPGLA